MLICKNHSLRVQALSPHPGPSSQKNTSKTFIQNRAPVLKVPVSGLEPSFGTPWNRESRNQSITHSNISSDEFYERPWYTQRVQHHGEKLHTSYNLFCCNSCATISQFNIIIFIVAGSLLLLFHLHRSTTFSYCKELPQECVGWNLVVLRIFGGTGLVAAFCVWEIRRSQHGA